MTFLNRDAMGQFQTALKGQPGDDTPPSTEDTPAPGGGSGDIPESVPAAEPADQSAAPAAKPAAPAAPAAPAQPDFDALFKSNPGLQSHLEQLSETKAQELLQMVAMRNPQAYEYFYGSKPPPGLFEEKPAAAPAPGAAPAAPKPEDLVAALSKRVEGLEQYKYRIESEQALDRLGDQLQTHMDKHEGVFKHPVWGEDAQNLLGWTVRQTLLRNPRADLSKITDEVATKYRKIEEHIKGEYTKGKGKAAKIPPGAGPPGAPVPGDQREKLKLGVGKNGTQGALAKYLSQQAQAQQS